MVGCYVLIDDDYLIQVSWRHRAIQAGINLIIFKNIENFIESREMIPKDAHIYIDSNLGNNEKGEIVSEKIYLMGYKCIFLETGYEDFDLSSYPWITKAVSKKAPF